MKINIIKVVSITSIKKATRNIYTVKTEQMVLHALKAKAKR